MKRDKYVAMDVDSANIVAGVYDEEGKMVMQCCIKNEGKTIQEFIKMLPGKVHVTFEEGTQAAWLYELIRPLVSEVIVCNPRENKLLKACVFCWPLHSPTRSRCSSALPLLSRNTARIAVCHESDAA